VLSSIVFLLVIDEVLRKSTEGKKRGITWRMTEQVEDLVFADDVFLLSHRLSGIQEKIKDVEKIGKKVGLKINETKKNVMRINTNTSKMEKIEINRKELEEVNEYSYLGSIVTGGAGADEDVTSRIKEANMAFVQLYRIWKNKNIRTKTKLKMFNSNVKASLLYGCETWKVTSSITQKLQSSINRCLRRIINVRWSEVISNVMLWETTGETPVELQIKKRKRKWIGHTIRKDKNAVERVALDWNPQGTRKRGRPKKTWKKSIMEEEQREGRTWREVKRLAADRNLWKSFVEALCSYTGDNRK
jgi:hypothetical protein